MHTSLSGSQPARFLTGRHQRGNRLTVCTLPPFFIPFLISLFILTLAGLGTAAWAQVPPPPGAPSGLSATAGNNQVSLRWTAPSGTILSYNVQRATVTGGPYTIISAVGAVTGTTYTDSTAANGTSYYYVVSAVGSGGEGPHSAEASALPHAPPPPPASLAAVPAAAQVTLSWTAVSGAVSYTLYRSTISGLELSYQTGRTGTRYTDTGLTSGTTYYYQITSVGTVGEGARSAEVSAIPGSTPLAAPACVKAAAGNAQVLLAWSSVSGAASYNVYRGGALLQSGLTGATFTDSGLTNGTNYSYQVASVSVSGQGALGSTVSATPGSPSLPAPLLAVTAGNGSTSFTWTAVPGASSYNVYRSTTAGGEGAVPYAVGIGGFFGLSYTDSAASNGTTYYYQIAPVAASGEGTYSHEASATPGVTPLPAMYSSVTSTPGYGSMTLSWTAQANATSYNIYKGGTVGIQGTPGVLYAVGLTGLTFTDSNLGPGTFNYHVQAVDKDGAGAINTYGYNGGATNDFSLALSPSPLTVTAGSMGETDINITRSGTITTLNLALTGTLPAGVSYTMFPLTTTAGSSLYFCVGAGVPGGTYTFTLTSSVPGNPSPWSHSIPVTLVVPAH